MSLYEAGKRSVYERMDAGKRCPGGLVLAVFIAVLFAGCASNQVRTDDAAGARTTTTTTTPTPQLSARATPPAATATDSAAYPKKTGLTRKERAAWRGVLKWPEDCEQAFATTHDTADGGLAGLEFYELAEKQYLVEVACAAGAYQGSQVYVFFDESKSPPATNLLTFQNYVAEDDTDLEKEETGELWGTSAFDAKTKQLTMLNKYRGPGDCGALATYGFEGGAPKLREFRAKTKCDGRGAENPKAWKKVTLP